MEMELLSLISPYQTPLNSSATAMVAGDFNNDGNLDVAICFIVTTDNQPSSLITIALGNGDGTFKSLFSNPEGWDFRGIAAADFNGDGILDLALTDHTGGYLVVMLGQGDGRFQWEESVEGPGIPLRVLISDFNHDGLPDIAYTLQNHGGCHSYCETEMGRSLLRTNLMSGNSRCRSQYRT